MQRCVYVFVHSLGVAATVNVRSVLQPCPKAPGVLQHPVLDVNFFALIAGKRGVEPCERSSREHRLEFFAIQKVVSLALVPEEKPVATVRADGAAFFEERAEGRDSRSRTNHDDWTIVIGGKAKAMRRSHEDRQG